MAETVPLLCTKDVCRLLKISSRQLARRISKGEFPEGQRIAGGHPRWSMTQIRDYLKREGVVL